MVEKKTFREERMENILKHKGPGCCSLNDYNLDFEAGVNRNMLRRDILDNKLQTNDI